MPELPEVEVLVRHLRPLIVGQRISGVEVRRARVIRPNKPAELQRKLAGATFEALDRRGKYLLFTLRPARGFAPFQLVGHLGMTGRMFVTPAKAQLPKHTAVVLNLGRQRFVYEDQRFFGRLTLNLGSLVNLGPEPLSSEFSDSYLQRELKRSRQSIKVKLLDQTLVAGIGNIYASEALYLSRLSPRLRADKLNHAQIVRLVSAIRKVLSEAIRFGSTIQLNHGPAGARDGLFYFGRAEGVPDYYEERLRVYNRAGQQCRRCRTPIRRVVQAARSTFFCSRCQC
jgi:formamidopyrimidine-DNA glycosylase